MNLQFIVVVVTTFLVINTYNDGKYIELIKSWKKYYIMGGYILIGLSVIYYIKKNPEDGLKLVSSGSGLLQSIPIDKSSKDIITPFLNSTLPAPKPMYVHEKNGLPSMKSTKRSVSESRKKFVAAQQNWTCAGCGCQLPAWYEVDHKQRLEYGGTNEIDNLEALCRDCHGKKTMIENL
tara:strand:+ start:2349 stop:2882 length:534 start_codon:yes stop_codon:yes gene_type:complete